MLTIEPRIPPNIGWLEAKLPENIIDLLWKYVNKSKENNVCYKNSLVGQITSSLELIDEDNYFFNNVLNCFLFSYHQNFQNIGENFGTTHVHKYCLNTFWANFQHQHEFNPVHKHTGCLFSFVIWLQIPTDWREQHNLPMFQSAREKSVSNFEFVYTDILGKIKTFPFYLDKTCNGKMLFFPSEFPHVVYPFYNSNEERISISGNIALDTSHFVTYD